MKIKIYNGISLVMGLIFLWGNSLAQTPTEKILIPAPVNLQCNVNGQLFLEKKAVIILETGKNGLAEAALFLKEYFKTFRNLDYPILDKLPVGMDTNTKVIRIIHAVKMEEVPRGFPSRVMTSDEEYNLVITKGGIEIRASGGAGVFYALQSILQLTSVMVEYDYDIQSGIMLPLVSIQDGPRFAYRGMHLDVCRHFFPVSFIKKYIDLLAMYKFNTLHWHLTEDQGWRIEIKNFPLLTTVGANRKETLVGKPSEVPKKFDGKPYGGFYTQEEIKEVVEYARQRFITIIPEIEMPGHAMAAIAAYPQLSCKGKPVEVATEWGVFEEVYCAGKEETFQFIENVLDEVCKLFPGQYVHIGGDECPKESWKACDLCQIRMKTEGLKDEHELQSYFIRRVEKILQARGKKLIGWDEILEGGLAPEATVMSWRGTEGGVAAAKMGHDVIMTPGSHCYFDHYQADPKTEPLAIGGFTTVEKVYAYEPIPAELNEEQAKHILGAQANVWTEYITTPEQVEYMAFPRACALAEVLWSPKGASTYADFVERFRLISIQLRKRNVNFAPHILLNGK